MFFSSQSNDLMQKSESKMQAAANTSRSHLENPLDSFFPFDPYLLNRSKENIEKLYVEYKNVVDDEMDLDSDESDDEDEEDTDEDDDSELDDDDNEQDDADGGRKTDDEILSHMDHSNDSYDD